MRVLESEVRELTLLKKVQLMEELWDDLTHRGDVLPVPQWHLDELNESAERLRNGEEKFEDWNEVKRRLRGS